MDRRTFLQNSAMLVGAGLLPTLSWGVPLVQTANALPPWRGFNLLDFFNPNPAAPRQKTSKSHLQWISDWGFDFVRIPIAYPYYLDFDRRKPITAESVFQLDAARIDEIEQLVQWANDRKLHVSLNLHRAPGYCINSGFPEPFHLWTDAAAQEAFYFHWRMWAKRFKDKTPQQISFDLVNEPSMRTDLNDQLSASGPVPGEYYRKVVAGALSAIRKENRQHLVVADGNNVGNDPVTEIADLPVAQSCRGYFPAAISHYKAPWTNKEPDKCPTPVWPGKMGDRDYNRATLEAYFEPWIALKNAGIGVHCGECGSWNRTPHAVFLAWFDDVIDILRQNRIGYALWNFIGDFGVLNSGRSDVAYSNFHGYKLDKTLLELLQKHH